MSSPPKRQATDPPEDEPATKKAVEAVGTDMLEAVDLTYKRVKEEFSLWTPPKRPYHEGGCDRWEPNTNFMAVTLHAKKHRKTGGSSIKQLHTPYDVKLNDDGVTVSMNVGLHEDRHCVEAMLRFFEKDQETGTTQKVIFFPPFWSDNPTTTDDKLSFEMVSLVLSPQDVEAIRTQVEDRSKDREELHGLCFIVVPDESECADCEVMDPETIWWPGFDVHEHGLYPNASMVTVDAAFLMDKHDTRKHVVEDGFTFDFIRKYLCKDPRQLEELSKTKRRKDGAADVFGDDHAKALSYRMELGNFEVLDGDERQLGDEARKHYVVVPRNADKLTQKQLDSFGGRFGRRLTAIGFVSPAKHDLELKYYARPKTKDGEPDLLNLNTLQRVDPEAEKKRAEERFADPFA
tara:strand:+ start:3410 stop:4621 length:1212 start_codon:yes stop_codon:yes gene_type:complete